MPSTSGAHDRITRMRLGRSACLHTLIVACSALHAQMVDGTLTDSVSHGPIPGVIVMLLGAERYEAVADEAGSFHIGPVQPGKYALNIVKRGYLLPPASQASFPVDSDTRLSVQMDPLSLVRGRVRYPDGRPAPRASVWLSQHPNGAARTVTADAGGDFVFDEVRPGQYILLAVANTRDPRAEGEVWAATYFPSTIDRASAQPIGVITGVTASQDIRLRSVPARHIRGIARDHDRRPANGVTVTLNAAALGEQPTAQTGEDGAFDFLAYDGEWRLTASRKAGDAEERGAVSVLVSKHDIENLEVRMALPFSIPIVIERDDPPGAEGRPYLTTAYLFHLDPPSMVAATGGAFQNVYPDRYRIYASSFGPGTYLESIKLGEVEVYGLPVEIGDGSLPIRIAFKRGAPVVGGTVESGDGATVVIFSADESSLGEDLRTVKTSRGGRFEIGNLRPGDYYLLAFDRYDPLTFTAALRRAVISRAEKVHPEKGGTVILNLKVTPWPQ